MTNPQKILIIGAGIGQVNLVELSHSMNLYVIVVSPKGNYPAISIADELFECDIYDRERIVEFAKKRHIDAVISDQNDLMMPTVAYVAEKLGLRGNTFQQVMSYCDKNSFRSICEKVGVPVPPHMAINDDKLIDFPYAFPWIVKPSDSQSNIGISKIDAIAEYQNAARLALDKSKLGTAIVEQFFEGEEFVCEGFVYQGKYYNLSFGDRQYFAGTMIPSQTRFPATLEEDVQRRIIEYEQRITDYIKPSFGIVHSEYLVNKQNKDICIIESAIRGGGVYISSHLIPMTIGVDINTLLLKCALGTIEKEDVECVLANKKDRSAAYVCFTLPNGVVQSIDGVEKIKNLEYVKMCDVSGVYVGMHTVPMQTKGMRKGPILVEAANRRELKERIEKIQSLLQIMIEDENGEIKQAIW